MTDTPQIPQDRPLVTFALFAYNQEKYIREAVEGAFSQTYEPLEIILSDDCSSDRTFEIMQEMAEAYTGPHAVRVRQNEDNLGLIEHINTVARTSSGHFSILAAGDDISLPERTSIIMTAFTHLPKARAIFSESLVIGEPREAVSEKSICANRFTVYDMVLNAGGIGKGATYAYHNSCFSWPAEIPREILSEDRILPLRASLIGNCYYLAEKLIYYRVEINSLTEKLEKEGKLAHMLPQHWEEVKNTLKIAAAEALISKLTLTSLLFSIRYINFSRSLCRKLPTAIQSYIAVLMFYPMRPARKLQSRPMFRLQAPDS